MEFNNKVESNNTVTDSRQSTIGWRNEKYEKQILNLHPQLDPAIFRECILHYIRAIEDLKALCLVCKHMNSLTIAEMVRRNSIGELPIQYTDPQVNLDCIIRYKLQRVTVKDFRVEHSKTLETLSIHCPSLRSLNLNDINVVTDNEMKILGTFTALDTLKVHQCWYNKPLLNCSLKTLIVSDHHEGSPIFLEKTALKHLENLKLNSGYDINLSRISNIKNLKTLHIPHISSTIEGLSHLQKLENLTKLRLESPNGPYTITVEKAQAICLCARLEEFIFTTRWGTVPLNFITQLSELPMMKHICLNLPESNFGNLEEITDNFNFKNKESTMSVINLFFDDIVSDWEWQIDIQLAALP